MTVPRGWKMAALVSLVLTAAMATLSGWAAAQLPADGQFPIHWNLEGQVDGYAGKLEALWLLPLLALGLSVLLAVIPMIDPRRENLRRSWKVYTIFWVTMVVFLAGVHGLVVSSALGHMVDVGVIVPLMVGVLLIILGNYMGKIRSNFFFGVRTPWTLSSELSWSKTHRLTGWLFVAVGAATIISLLLSPAVTVAILVGGTLASAAAATVYSYVVWKRDPAKNQVRSGPEPPQE
jgi:uncharacterized membrane protein